MAELTLAIETSNPSSAGAGVAVGVPGKSSVFVEALRASDRHDDLVSAIDRLCARHLLSPRDLKRIAVSTGPGGYTSLRIAVAVTKMMCESLGAECVPVLTAAAVARRAVGVAAPFAVVLASKDRTAFATVFAATDRQVGEGRLIGAADVAGLGVRTLVADGHLPNEIAAAACNAKVTIHPPTFDPTAILELSHTAPAIDPIQLAPLYPREPEAVTKWRSRLPK